MSHRGSAIRIALLLALTSVAVAPAGEAAAAAWSEPTLLVRTTRPVRLVAAGVAASEAVVAWQDYDVVGEGRQQTSQNFKLWAATAPVGHGFGVPQQLDRTYADPWPALAVSATGYGALAWNREGRNVAVAVRAPGARFSAPIDIPAEGVVSAPVKVGVDDSGTATVLWSDWAGVDAPARVRYATVSAGGALTAVGTVGADTSPGGWVFLAVGSAGDVAAAWATAAAGASPGRETRVALRPREAVAPRDGNAASLPSQAMTPPPAVFSTTLKRSAATLGVVAGLLPAAVPATAAGLAGTNPGQPSDVRPNAGAATQGIIMRDGGICDPIRMGC